MLRLVDPDGRRFSRREFLKKGGEAAFVLSVLGFSPLPTAGENRRGVIVSRSEIPILRKKLESQAMAYIRRQLEQFDHDEAMRLLSSGVSYKRRIWDIPVICQNLRKAAFIAAVTGDSRGLRVVERAFETLLSFPNWDYFVDGDRTIGLQRAPASVLSVVLALELVGDNLPDKLRSAMERDLGEKGCTPCYWTLYGMDHPELVRGWDFAPDAEVNFSELDMSRWPIILRSTNLHAVPLSALGIGALYLRGKDPRAEQWLALAKGHVRDYCKRTIGEDGVYLENISYWGYAIAYLTLFLRGLERVTGEDMFDVTNFPGQVEFAIAMQAGRAPAPDHAGSEIVQADGQVWDVVNFSDSGTSFRQEGALAIAAKLRDPVAQKVALERPGTWSVFAPIVYDPSVPAAEDWPRHLLRKRFSNDWVVWRTGWEDDDVVIGFRSGGPANHEHADRNSMVLKAFGEWLLRDPRGAAYDRFNERWLLRLTEAHNAVLIDGQGHGYVDGTEGTNSSRAWAKIRRYIERDNWMALSSDATQAYRLLNPRVRSVVRTVVWVVPRLLLVFDKVVSSARVTLSQRFFPDNVDGKGLVVVRDPTFQLRRPKATLAGKVISDHRVTIATGALPLKEPKHPYRYVEVKSARARSLAILTAMVFGPNGESLPDVQMRVQEKTFEAKWREHGQQRTCRIYDVGELPEIEMI